MSEQIDLSKGWMQRPGDVDAYRVNYDAIFGKKKKPQPEAEEVAEEVPKEQSDN